MAKVNVSLWLENGWWVTLLLILVIPVMMYFVFKE